MNVFCDPVSIRMRAWQLVAGQLAVTSAVCISVFVCVVVLVKVVIADVTFLLFCGSSCFSSFLPFEQHCYLVWPDRRQLRHLFFCGNMVFLSFVDFTFEQLV